MSENHAPVPVEMDRAVTPGLFRRLAIIVYDSLLLIALLTLATALVVLPAGLLLDVRIPDGHPLFRAYLVAISLLFYCGFWVHGGQTLGMRAWRVRLVSAQGLPVELRRALLRYFAAILSWAPLGLGFWWVLADPKRLAWHDRLSGTRMVMLEKTTKRGSGPTR
jgi:uncharacterized RDD family membrane protein YckC